MLEIFILFFTSIIATALSSMSGGGASVINVPILLWMGASFPLAMATQKVSSIFWFLPASFNYLKDRKINWLFLIIFSAVGLLGAYWGVSFIISMDERIMEIIAGILILSLVFYTFFKKDFGLIEQKIYSKFQKFLSYPFALILGFYESVFGSGNGILFAVLALKTRGFDFVDALGYYFSIAFPWAIFASILLILKGYYDFKIMIPVILGSFIGGYIGSKYAKYKGAKFIKSMFVIIGIILSLKLILGF